MSPDFSRLSQKMDAVFAKPLFDCSFSFSADVRGEWTDGTTKNGLANVNEAILFNSIIINSGSTPLGDFCPTDASLGNGCLECMAPGTIVSPGNNFTCDFIYEVC